MRIIVSSVYYILGTPCVDALVLENDEIVSFETIFF
jgi:hypothetical protein